MKKVTLAALAMLGMAGLGLGVIPADAQAPAMMGGIVKDGKLVPDWQGIPVAKAIVTEPTISPDGKTIAFVYDGDIWSLPATGGTARRLTSTLGNDGSPIFSPDGKWLAFSSRKFGSTSVFVMPAEGGPSTRLTQSPSGEAPRCWLPDSSGIIFNSSRLDLATDLWVVRLDGGEPWPITANGHRESELFPDISPDGKLIAYVRRGGSRGHERRGYDGSNNSDLWICDFDGVLTSNHRPLTSTRAHESFPQFLDNQTILFTSFVGQGGSNRVARVDAISVNGAPSNVGAKYRVFDPNEMRISGGRMVAAAGAYGGWNITVTDLATGAISTPSIVINSDTRDADLIVSTLATTSDYAPSPDGKLVAFVAGEDVWVMGADETAVARQVTDTVCREKDVVFLGDNRRIVYSSSRSGQFQLYMYDLVARAERQLTSFPEGASRPHVLLGGRSLLYCWGERELRTLTVPSGMDGEVAHGTVAIKGEFLGADRSSGAMVSVSPDSKWIAFTNPNSLGDTQVFVGNLETGQTRQLSRHFQGAGDPVFGRCGKRIIYACFEGSDPSLHLVDLVPPKVTFDEDKLDDLLKAPSRVTKESGESKPAEPKGEEAKPEEAKPAEGEAEKPTPGRPAGAKPKGPPATEIQWEGIENRTRRITTSTGAETDPIGLDDGKTVIYSNGGNLFSITVELDKPIAAPKPLTTGTTRKSNPILSDDGKTLWYLDTGVVQKGKPAGGGASTHRFSVRQTRNKRDLKAEAFRECVWTMGRYFYDPSMHGVDWEAISKRYLEALDSTGTNEEWGDLMNQLLGELNSSHQGFTARDGRSDGFSESIATLGLVFDARELAAGRYKIVEALKRGPCDPERADVKVGEYLVGINGTMIGKGFTLNGALNGAAGKKTVLHLSPAVDSKAIREVPVKPMSSAIESGLWYDRWIDAQREMVNKLSNGRLGYVHIRSMDEASVEHFKHHLGNDLEGKEGAVIDVRFNGGGSTAVDLLEILIKREWLKRTRRSNDEPLSENVYRSVAWEKPACLLTNFASFSNAEIMSEGFQRLKIGQVVGTETGGGVIGTSSASLIDGSRIRMPMSGAYTVDMENLENKGRKPTIEVDNTPDILATGRDAQIETAVKVLLAEADERKAKAGK